MPSAPMILRAVARYRNVRLDALRGPSRARQIVIPRQEACWSIRRRTDLSLPQIGLLLGGRDHTTVMHAVAEVDRRVAVSPEYRQAMDRLLALVDSIEEVADEHDDETLIQRARRIVSHPETATAWDAQHLSVRLLVLVSSLDSALLTDPEARKAALSVITGRGGAGHA